jgi:REP-associated tyrosine transposase
MRNKATGHLWQGRFYSCQLDERHLYAGVRYVETNPVRAGIVKKAEDYKWSSARSHVKGKIDPILSNDYSVLKKIRDWSACLREKEDVSAIDTIRQNTRTGRPCGDDLFAQKIEKLLGRRLAALPRGRPRKA